MSFTFLTVITPDEDEIRDMYPRAGDTPGQPVRPEDGDGAEWEWLSLRGLTVERMTAEGWDKIFESTELPFRVAITNGRVIVHSEKVAKGGGWGGFGAGGIAVAMVANGISKARAAHTNKGKALAGHLRYPWVSWVGASPGSGLLSAPELRLLCVDQNERLDASIKVNLYLPRKYEALAVAQKIARLVVASRASDPTIDASKRRLLEDLVEEPLPTPRKGRLSSYELPVFAAEAPPDSDEPHPDSARPQGRAEGAAESSRGLGRRGS